MLRAILNKSWRQHPTRLQLYGNQPPITKTIQVRRTRHAGHCWRSRDELIRDVLLWTPTHGHAKAGRPARTYIQQLCKDTGCCPKDLPRTDMMMMIIICPRNKLLYEQKYSVFEICLDSKFPVREEILKKSSIIKNSINYSENFD